MKKQGAKNPAELAAHKTREKMIAYREKRGYTINEMSAKCKCSVKLLEIVEHGGITHPDIAADIARAYKLSVKDYNTLVSEKNRVDKIPDPKPEPEWKGWDINWRMVSLDPDERRRK